MNQHKAGNECQCPQRASIHFYRKERSEKIYRGVVSMPSTGFYPFLHTITDAWDFGYICVNALNGLLSISTLTSYIRSQKLKVCQCPQRASSHFYRVYYQKWKADSACQCPQRASIHFYYM